PRIAVLLDFTQRRIGNGVALFLRQSLPQPTHDLTGPPEGKGNREAQKVAAGPHPAMRTYRERESSWNSLWPGKAYCADRWGPGEAVASKTAAALVCKTESSAENDLQGGAPPGTRPTIRCSARNGYPIAPMRSSSDWKSGPSRPSIRKTKTNYQG